MGVVDVKILQMQRKPRAKICSSSTSGRDSPPTQDVQKVISDRSEPLHGGISSVPFSTFILFEYFD